ncbi:MAG: hypothetical protein ACLP9L_02570 [Thermoguttaceae bacterium]
MSRKDKLLRLTASANLWMKKVIGEENVILYHFAQFALIAIIVALLVSVAVWIVALATQAVSALASALLMVMPYLLTIAVIAGVVALLVYVYRSNTSKRRREVEKESEVGGQNALPMQADAHRADEAIGVRQSLLAADQQTRKSLESVLAKLQRFDHRLELVITPTHYADVFGDNWVNVREFVESSQGRNVPEVSAKLVEIVILYKRAQDVRWVPINHERIHAWWSEASRRRKWLSDAVEATASGSGPADVPEERKAAPMPGISVVSPSPETQEGTAPKFTAPPTLDELLRYYEWVNHRSHEPGH